MSSKKKTKLNELSFVELQTQLEHTFWNIDKEEKENKKEKLQKLKFEIIDELQKFYDIDYLYITLNSKNENHLCDDDIKNYYVWSRDIFTNEIVKLTDVSTDRKFCDYILERRSLKEIMEENNIKVEINYYRKEELKVLFDEINNQIKLTK